MPELFHLHPIAVHFPIAFLTLGLIAAIWELKKASPLWITGAVSLLLWLGTVSAWVTLSLGLLAEETAPHVPPAWQVLADHETFAWWTVGLFTLLSVLRYVLHRRAALEKSIWRKLLVAGWLIGFGLLTLTAKKGGELVYKYGMGVVLER